MPKKKQKSRNKLRTEEREIERRENYSISEIVEIVFELEDKIKNMDNKSRTEERKIERKKDYSISELEEKLSELKVKVKNIEHKGRRGKNKDRNKGKKRAKNEFSEEDKKIIDNLNEKKVAHDIQTLLDLHKKLYSKEGKEVKQGKNGFFIYQRLVKKVVKEFIEKSENEKKISLKENVLTHYSGKLWNELSNEDKAEFSSLMDRPKKGETVFVARYSAPECIVINSDSEDDVKQKTGNLKPIIKLPFPSICTQMPPYQIVTNKTSKYKSLTDQKQILDKQVRI
ncbi:uncharacterized protein OCT59_015905 [Rhizophagus irregularis]|uniref:Uncharacterized protein n=2 Tax=Rhizophagus irregularis TaxID=588596 RepID=U9T1U6_RHIID|nr:hypothetical protein GLOIN_2v1696929 [Rhizophagus irregularis DAOM 181602=DAOM 197198]EXX70464.1 hypothetical protein RirG_087170 [Rhizophagus irregularis DAOM 197198w]POG62334.1 hypothetical protein GLOIN_2v1696929 [Rhizophagus irregularis DAOM 181602=DAOM 197198]UZO23572.1 hypothetical protein OCT59_015905 [Rhizophagus irregularis]|eukprot:XP_025169200.1 hypothetical protein GLOIN_2v1696929 [Rhizophagus irregularis DAOM 181602=DAOM 197198]